MSIISVGLITKKCRTQREEGGHQEGLLRETDRERVKSEDGRYGKHSKQNPKWHFGKPSHTDTLKPR